MVMIMIIITIMINTNRIILNIADILFSLLHYSTNNDNIFSVSKKSDKKEDNKEEEKKETVMLRNFANDYHYVSVCVRHVLARCMYVCMCLCVYVFVYGCVISQLSL